MEGFDMKYFLITLVGALLLLVDPAVAQDRFGVELRVGSDFATQDLGDMSLNTGFGSEVVFSYRFIPHLAAYGGYGYGRASTDGPSFAGTDVVVEETGYTFGLQHSRPLRASRYGYFVRGGGLYNHLELESGDRMADSGHGLGWQIEAGPIATFGQKWTVMPGLRYRSLSRDIEIVETSTEVDRTYLSLGVGLLRTF
jgi:hypothetical protein